MNFGLEHLGGSAEPTATALTFSAGSRISLRLRCSKNSRKTYPGNQRIRVYAARGINTYVHVTRESPPELRTPEAEAKPDPREGQGPEESNRIRMVTSTGRVRTYTASRNLPGVTLRMTESRWERLKLLSIQECRPIQEILGEAMADFMRSRGLPW
jgi:hypothetical protein